jgi:hypothetical protein
MHDVGNKIWMFPLFLHHNPKGLIKGEHPLVNGKPAPEEFHHSLVLHLHPLLVQLQVYHLVHLAEVVLLELLICEVHPNQLLHCPLVLQLDLGHVEAVMGSQVACSPHCGAHLLQHLLSSQILVGFEEQDLILGGLGFELNHEVVLISVLAVNDLLFLLRALGSEPRYQLVIEEDIVFIEWVLE